jgi:hypothetical protein
MEKLFDTLKKHFGSHKAAARYLGISYNRYNEWRGDPDKMPSYSQKLVEYGVKALSDS